MKLRVYVALAFFAGLAEAIGTIALASAMNDASVDKLESRLLLEVDEVLADKLAALERGDKDPLAGAPELVWPKKAPLALSSR